MLLDNVKSNMLRYFQEFFLGLLKKGLIISA